MKRSLAAATAAIVLLVGLAACGGSSSNSSSGFCDLVKTSQSQLDNVDASDANAFSTYTAALAALVKSAPSEIKSDLQTVADAASAFQKNGTVPDQSKIEAAVNHLDDYAKNTCHVDLSGNAGSDSSSFSSLGSPIGSDASSSGNAAGDSSSFCAVFDATKLAELGSGSSSVQDYVNKLKDISPPDAIKDDWNSFVEAIGVLATANPSDSGYASAQAKVGAAAVKVVTYYQTNCAATAN